LSRALRETGERGSFFILSREDPGRSNLADGFLAMGAADHPKTGG
jgi:hypothetical protein